MEHLVAGITTVNHQKSHILKGYKNDRGNNANGAKNDEYKNF